MPKITRDQVRVPADVMPESRDEYIENFMKATRGTGRLMLFACDQKIEHLNKDFYGEGIDIADAEPQHLFEIGRQGVCGVLAGQRGLIAQYAADYPEITVDDYYIDIMAANLVNERVRGQFQVLLLPNLYGDIITDEAAQLQGGVGTAGSANIGDRYAMFEAIHGSAPRMIERGMGDYANPQSILRAEVMLLRHIGRAAAADRLEAALDACPAVITGQPDGATCAGYGDGILKLL